MKNLRGKSLSESQNEAELSALMRKAQSGDCEAYRELLLRVKKLIESYANNFLFRSGKNSPETVEDLSQEVLTGLHAKRHTYDPSQFFLPWLYAIARYKVLDFIRDSKKRAHHVGLDSHFTESFSVAMTPENAMATIDANALLTTLPDKQKEVLKMVKLDGLSVTETSAHTGFSESDIKVTVHRALKNLRQKLRS